MSRASHEFGLDPRIGVLVPMSGVVSMYAMEITNAAQIAAAEVNLAGGVLGRQLRVVVEDDGSMPESAVPAARRLVEHHGCQALVGTLLSNARIAVASQVAEKERIPLLNFSFNEGSVRGPFFFNFAALPNQQISKMVPYVAHRYGPKMYFAGNDYEWPAGSIAEAKRCLRLAGGEVVGEEYFSFGSERFAPLLARVERSGADVFVPYGAGEDQLRLLRAFHDAGLKRRLTAVTGHFDEVLAGQLSPAEREGILSCNTYFMSIPGESNQRYLERLVAQPGVEGLWPAGNGRLTNFGEGAYLCVRAWAQAANDAGTLDPSTVAAAIARVEIEGPQGRVIMDPRLRYAAVNSYLARCRADGSFEILEHFGRVAPAIPPRYEQPPAARRSWTDLATVAPREEDEPSARPLDPGLLDCIDSGLLTVDASGNIVDANHQAAATFGYTRAELCALHFEELIPPRFRQEHRRLVSAFQEATEQRSAMTGRRRIRGYRKNGTEFPADASVGKLRTAHGERFVITVRDVSERVAAERELAWRASHDPLTDLPNRTLLRDRLVNALARTARSGETTALLFLDLDEFKHVNDSHGHQAGDRLLQELADRLLRVTRTGDTVGRFGGDEFLILCEGVRGEAEALEVAQKLLEVVRHPFRLATGSLYLTASLGIALSTNSDKPDPDHMLAEADAAMYAAKRAGRDKLFLADRRLRQRSQRRTAVASRLREAVDAEALRIVFQPIVDIDRRRTVGIEALTRWEDERLGPVSPGEFIPVAESTGLIRRLGLHALERASLAHGALLREGWGPLNVSVNVSARQLDDPQFPMRLVDTVEAVGGDPSIITLELTEGALLTELQGGGRVLRGLAELGFRLAIDDFGTGYSSLSYLRALPVEMIKIDKAFIDDLTQPGGRELVAAMIHMARSLSLEVTAEGVESTTQIDILDELGCRFVQGYVYARPMDLDQLRRFLRDEIPPLEQCGAG